jgi:hypothetical protein
MESPPASRRAVLGAGASLLAASQAQARPRRGAPDPDVMRILERYDSFGDKASGGPGDTACGEWLEGELKALGYACARQAFDAPAFEGEARLTCGSATAALIPQAIVRPTPRSGVTGPLSIAGRGAAGGGVALVVLPYARWSTIKGEPERRVRAAIAAGAEAVVLVTTGPTREAVALNAPLEPALFDRPVAILAPKDAGPFVEAAQSGASANLVIEGRAFRRPAFNLTARLDRGPEKTLVISTPRSGWFGCAGERGSGLAAWLLLARWAAGARLPVNLTLVATSGHEYEYAGGELYIAQMAPKPAETALWVHVGANAAARDWHERGPILSPLPSADPQRFLLASAPLLDAARAAFAGLPGLEAAYAADPKAAAGELASILHAGYGPVIGLFGVHRYHHTRGDDLRCVSAELVAPVAEGFEKVITAALAQA